MHKIQWFIKQCSINIFKESINQPLDGLGNFTPNTFSIFAITAPVGTDFPAYHAFTSDLGICIIFANCSWFHPLAFRAWAIAILS